MTWILIEQANATAVLITTANSRALDEPAHPRSLDRAIAARKHKAVPYPERPKQISDL